MKKYILLLILLLCGVQTRAQNWSSYPTYEQYTEYMQDLSASYPSICHLDTIGTTTEGRLLLCMRIDKDINTEKNRPKLFYSAAMHGNELTGAMMLLYLLDTLAKNIDNICLSSSFPIIYICPFANPDGTWAAGNSDISGAMRYNANYVDLNRNYPDIRSSQNSDGESIQKETQAFIAYQKKEKFHISCNIHTGSEVFNYPWDTYKSKTKTHADNNWFLSLGEEFVSSLNDESGDYFTAVNSKGVVEGGDWYVIHGSRQDWSTYFAHCREITLEVSNPYYPPFNEIKDYWQRLGNALFTFVDYCDLGIEGVVRDSVTGKTLDNVMIEIEAYDKDSSEVFTNDSGYYFRPLLDSSYCVSFSKKGYNNKSLMVGLGKELKRIDVQLSPLQTSIENIPNLELEIYPTLVENLVYISTKNKSIGLMSNLRYEIIDLWGRIIERNRINSLPMAINTKNLSFDTYIINIYAGEKIIKSEKIIKK